MINCEYTLCYVASYERRWHHNTCRRAQNILGKVTCRAPLLLPVINLPFRPSLQGLTLLWNVVEIWSQHNSNAALLTFGAVAMNLYFQTLVDLKGVRL